MRLRRGGSDFDFLAIVSSAMLHGVARAHQKFFDDDLVDVLAANASVSVRGSDNLEPLVQVRLQRRRIVRPDEREYLLVPTPHRCCKHGLEQVPGNALAPALEIDVRSQHTDMVERMRVAGERLHALEPYDSVVRLTDGHEKHTARRKIPDVLSLCLGRERRVECRIQACGNDGVQNADYALRVLRPCLTNLNWHRTRSASALA